MNNERRILVDQARGGDAGDRPTLVGEYTFSNLNTNVGLTDEDFSEIHPHYFFARRTMPLARQEPKDKSAVGGFGGNGGSTPKTPCQHEHRSDHSPKAHTPLAAIQPATGNLRQPHGDRFGGRVTRAK